MKNRTLTTIFILLSFIFLTGNKLFCDENLDKKIENLIKNNPKVAQEMIKKLFILEHSTPEISFPVLTIVENDSSNYSINFDKHMKIKIGNDAYNLLYDIELTPKDVIVAVKPVKHYEWLWFTGGVVLGGFLGFIVVNTTMP